ncbi:hypothetical protein Tco_0270573 [Tanacetum coccineum]
MLQKEILLDVVGTSGYRYEVRHYNSSENSQVMFGNEGGMTDCMGSSEEYRRNSYDLWESEDVMQWLLRRWMVVWVDDVCIYWDVWLRIDGVGGGWLGRESDVFSQPSYFYIDDAFSSNFLNYTPTSPDYFPTSPRSISPDPSNDLTKYLLASLAISPFHNDPYMKVIQAYDAIPPP